MNASRRDIFKRAVIGLTGVAGLAALSACSSVSSPAAGSNDVKLLATGLTAVLTALAGVPGVPADVLAKVQTEVNLINSIADEIGSAVAPAPSLGAQIDNAVTAIAALVTPFFPAAAGIATVVKAAVAFLPVVLAVFGISMIARYPSMGPNQARSILEDAAAIVVVH